MPAHKNRGCKLPPEGWWCAREPGHEGPCCALPSFTFNESSGHYHCDYCKACVYNIDTHRCVDLVKTHDTPDVERLATEIRDLVRNYPFPISGFDVADVRPILEKYFGNLLIKYAGEIEILRRKLNRTQPQEESVSIGHCNRCGAPKYHDGGFCGVCQPQRY